jgi:hypothetical protein
VVGITQALLRAEHRQLALGASNFGFLNRLRAIGAMLLIGMNRWVRGFGTINVSLEHVESVVTAGVVDDDGEERIDWLVASSRLENARIGRSFEDRLEPIWLHLDAREVLEFEAVPELGRRAQRNLLLFEHLDAVMHGLSFGEHVGTQQREIGVEDGVVVAVVDHLVRALGFLRHFLVNEVWCLFSPQTPMQQLEVYIPIAPVLRIVNEYLMPSIDKVMDRKSCLVGHLRQTRDCVLKFRVDDGEQERRVEAYVRNGVGRKQAERWAKDCRPHCCPLVREDVDNILPSLLWCARPFFVSYPSKTPPEDHDDADAWQLRDLHFQILHFQVEGSCPSLGKGGKCVAFSCFNEVEGYLYFGLDPEKLMGWRDRIMFLHRRGGPYAGSGVCCELAFEDHIAQRKRTREVLFGVNC